MIKPLNGEPRAYKNKPDWIFDGLHASPLLGNILADSNHAIVLCLIPHTIFKKPNYILQNTVEYHGVYLGSLHIFNLAFGNEEYKQEHGGKYLAILVNYVLSLQGVWYFREPP